MMASKDRHASAVERRRASRGSMLAMQAVVLGTKHHGGGYDLEYSIVGGAIAAEAGNEESTKLGVVANRKARVMWLD
jgi:hypothetical protein